MARLCKVVLGEWIPPHKRLPVAKWYRLLGELRSMSPALSRTGGLFSVLQHAFSRGDQRRLRLSQRVYDVAAEFTALVDSLAECPTRLLELVPTAPLHVGACDACRHRMGGIWLDATGAAAPIILWRQSFSSPRVSADLITADHPTGSITISDFEIAGIISHKNIIAQACNVCERNLWIASNDRATVPWSHKGSSTSTTARAYLLHFNALHQCRHRYLARHHYMPSPINAKADDTRRQCELSDAHLITQFSCSYPQEHSRELYHLPSETNASVTDVLYRRHPPWMSLYSNSLSSASAQAPSPPAATLSALGQWRTLYKR